MIQFVCDSTTNHHELIQPTRKTGTRFASAKGFLVEGLHHIGAALEAHWEVENLIYAPEVLKGDYSVKLLEDARDMGVTIQPVSGEVMNSLSGKEHPQGILAVVKQRLTKIEDLHDIRTGVALVAPQDPGNAGSILRTMDAVGSDVLFQLDGGVDIYHPSLVRASMGALFWIPVVQLSFGDFIEWTKKKHIKVVGTSSHADKDYRAAQAIISPWVLIFGSEQKGLSPDQISCCDMTLALPMRGMVSSLNISVAAGIFLYKQFFDNLRR
jgi:TrmH family RNA methyltransferase